MENTVIGTCSENSDQKTCSDEQLQQFPQVEKDHEQLPSNVEETHQVINKQWTMKENSAATTY